MQNTYGSTTTVDEVEAAADGNSTDTSTSSSMVAEDLIETAMRKLTEGDVTKLSKDTLVKRIQEHQHTSASIKTNRKFTRSVPNEMPMFFTHVAKEQQQSIIKLYRQLSKPTSRDIGPYLGLKPKSMMNQWLTRIPQFVLSLLLPVFVQLSVFVTILFTNVASPLSSSKFSWKMKMPIEPKLWATFRVEAKDALSGPSTINAIEDDPTAPNLSFMVSAESAYVQNTSGSSGSTTIRDDDDGVSNDIKSVLMARATVTHKRTMDQILIAVNPKKEKVYTNTNSQQQMTHQAKKRRIDPNIDNNNFDDNNFDVAQNTTRTNTIRFKQHLFLHREGNSKQHVVGGIINYNLEKQAYYITMWTTSTEDSNEAPKLDIGTYPTLCTIICTLFKDTYKSASNPQIMSTENYGSTVYHLPTEKLYSTNNGEDEENKTTSIASNREYALLCCVMQYLGIYGKSPPNPNPNVAIKEAATNRTFRFYHNPITHDTKQTCNYHQIVLGFLSELTPVMETTRTSYQDDISTRIKQLVTPDNLMRSLRFLVDSSSRKDMNQTANYIDINGIALQATATSLNDGLIAQRSYIDTNFTNRIYNFPTTTPNRRFRIAMIYINTLQENGMCIGVLAPSMIKFMDTWSDDEEADDETEFTMSQSR